MSLHEQWVDSYGLQERRPLTPGLLVNPFPPVKQMSSLKESVEQQNVAPNSQLFQGPRRGR